jgi:hypothetical protein
MDADLIRQVLDAEVDALMPPQVNLWPSIESSATARSPGRSRQLRVSIGRIVIVSLALGLIAVAIRLAARVPNASASEILRRADAVWASQVSGAEVIFESYSVAGREGNLFRADLWRTVDGAAMRYELTNRDGELVFFAMRQGDQVWRSLHDEAPGETPVEVVLHATAHQLEEISSDTRVASPLFRSLFYGLPDLNDLLLARREECLSVSCLLDSPELGDERVRLVGEDVTELGRQVYVIAIREGVQPDPSSLDRARLLTIDSESFELVQYTDIQGNSLVVLQHRPLSEDEEPEVLFLAAPEGARVIEVTAGWQPSPPAQSGEGDVVSIVSAAPSPSVPLTGREQFDVSVHYRLVSSPLATLEVLLVPQCLATAATNCDGSVAGGDRVIVGAGTGTIHVEFTLDEWNLQDQLVLSAYLDTGGIARYFTDYTWEPAGQ